MQNLSIAGSQSTPSIMTDWDKGLMSIQGDSYPENSFEFFDPIIDWIEHFLRQTQHPLRLELRLVYMNTSSVKAMMDIFDILEESFRQGRQVSVEWYYDARNERVVDMVHEFTEDCSFPFGITPDAK